jgi:hypothetical protein
LNLNAEDLERDNLELLTRLKLKESSIKLQEADRLKEIGDVKDQYSRKHEETTKHESQVNSDK